MSGATGHMVHAQEIPILFVFMFASFPRDLPSLFGTRILRTNYKTLSCMDQDNLSLVPAPSVHDVLDEYPFFL